MLLKVTFLGHAILKEGIKIDPQKVKAVTEWIRSTSIIECRSFLGLASYYPCFVQDFSKIGLPLTNLLRRTMKFERNDRCKESFYELKRKLTTAPVVALPVEGGELTIYSDTSKQGIEWVLMQDRRVEHMH